MLEHGFGLYVAITLVLIVLLIISNAIPFYGFMHKRWKGCFLGCLIQPVVCALFIMIAIVCIVFHQQYGTRKLRKAAMVTLRKTEIKGNTRHTFIWHLKPDEECFYEYKKTPVSESKDNVKNEDEELYDVVPLDSFSVCVDDRIVVRFDLKNRMATATNYGEPIEVVRIDWDKVNAYFEKLSK